MNIQAEQVHEQQMHLQQLPIAPVMRLNLYIQHSPCQISFACEFFLFFFLLILDL